MRLIPALRADEAFDRAFGHSATHHVLAPGRVNLIGEHTDYNGGFVLPCAIDRGTVAAARPRSDALIRVVAADFDESRDEFRLDQPIVPRSDAPWANYVRGVVQQLQAHGLQFGGAELALAGDVPQGAGLSSSASLEVAVIQVLKSLYALDIDPSQAALIAQRAENEFVGCNCGIMDQLISARGREGHAVLIDCRSLETEPVPLRPDVAVVIVESRVKRGLVESEYNLRRAQCETAARQLGASSLRDVDEPALEAGRSKLDDLTYRRARHVVTENRRTLEAAQALRGGDLVTMGRLMAQSHESMRLDFEITVPAIDQLVQILQDVIGSHGGARMTGGGFGGCVVALMPQALVPAARDAVRRLYRSPSGDAAVVHVCNAAAGAGDLACRTPDQPPPSRRHEATPTQ
jgi:galactokinase